MIKRVTQIFAAGAMLAIGASGFALKASACPDCHKAGFTTISAPVTIERQISRPVVLERRLERPIVTPVVDTTCRTQTCPRVISRPVVMDRVVDRPVVMDRFINRPILMENVVEHPVVLENSCSSSVTVEPVCTDSCGYSF